MAATRVSEEAQKLLVEIARCPLVALNVEDDRPTHPCHTVVTHQWPDIPAEKRRGRWRREHHLPEPWCGDLEHAPLLFLSSNPALSSPRKPRPPSDGEFAKAIDHLGEHSAVDHRAFRHGLAAPKPTWDDDEIVDRSKNALSVWSVSGTHLPKDETGERDKRVAYWVAAREVAEAIYARPDVEPGLDYALSEVVHCKSSGEDGMQQALRTCSSLYLERVLALSPARLIVVFGDHARNAVRGVFSYPQPGVVTEPIRVAKRSRRFVFLAHPSNRQKNPRYPRRLTGSDLAHVHDLFQNG